MSGRALGSARGRKKREPPNKPKPKRESAPSRASARNTAPPSMLGLNNERRGRKKVEQVNKPRPRESAPSRASTKNLADKAEKQKKARASNPPGSRSGNPTGTSWIDSTAVIGGSAGFSDAMNAHFKRDFKAEREARDTMAMGPRGSFLRDEAMFVSNRRGATAGSNQYYERFGRNVPPQRVQIPGRRDDAIMGGNRRRRYVYPPQDGPKRYLD